MAKKFTLQIITPKKVVFQDKVISVTAPSSSGEITILYNHTPLVSLLKEGVVKIVQNGEETFFSIGGGYVETTGKEVNLLVSRAYGQDELDEKAIKQAKEKAERLIQESKTEEERRQAMASLRRSIIDLRLLGLARKSRRRLGEEEAI